MATTDSGWTEVYDLLPQQSAHPEEEVQRRQLAAQDAQRRARLPEWEAELPRAEAVVAERQAAVDAAVLALDEATAANARKYQRVTGGRGVRDPLLGRPIAWLDDPRCEPEISRRKLAEQVLSAARAELAPAQAWRNWVHAECCLIKGTIPARA